MKSTAFLRFCLEADIWDLRAFHRTALPVHYSGLGLPDIAGWTPAPSPQETEPPCAPTFTLKASLHPTPTQRHSVIKLAPFYRAEIPFTELCQALCLSHMTPISLARMLWNSCFLRSPFFSHEELRHSKVGNPPKVTQQASDGFWVHPTAATTPPQDFIMRGSCDTPCPPAQSHGPNSELRMSPQMRGR